MITFFRRTIPLLSRSARRRMWITCAILAVQAVMEAVALLSIAPLMSILTAPNLRPNSRFVTDLDKAFGHPAPTQLALWLGIATVILYTVKSVAAVSTFRWSIGFILREEATIVRRLISGYLYAPYRETLRVNSSARLRNLTAALRAVFQEGFVACLSATGDAISTVLLGAILLVANPLIAVTVGVYFGLITFTYQRITNRYIGRRATELHREQAADFQSIHQALSGVKEIKVRGAEEAFSEEIYKRRRGLVSAYRTMALVNTTPRYVLEMSMVGAASTIAAVAFSTESINTATATLGLFLVGGFRMLAPLNKIIFANAQAKASMPSLDTIVADLADTRRYDGTGDPGGVSAEGVSPMNDSEPPVPLAPRVCFDDVSFSYLPDTPVLRNVSFEIRPGESIGLVGGSGAGKSTLVDIILGLLEPSAGSVKIDGRPLQEVGRQWQRMIGYVPQSIAMFDDTIEANIVFGAAPKGADVADVWRALELSQLDSTVRELPDGLQTLVGEAGTRLSGGQRQRLGVARALYRRPDVLIFDEATSALDNETEFRLTEVLDSLKGSVTMITIAHRLSTVRRCDRVFYLDHGLLMASGTFSELTDTIPGFARLVELSSLDVG